MTKKKKKARPRKAIFELIYTDEELCQFWDWFHVNHTDPYWQAPSFYTALILCTGLRKSEALAIKIEHCTTRPTPLVYIERGKGGHAREVEILPQFEPIFVDYVEQARVQYNAKRPYASPYLFPGRSKWPNYLPISGESAEKWWKKCFKAAGLRELGVHTGRRVFASYVTKIPYPDEKGIARYISPTDLQAQLGHLDFKMTAEYYIKSIPGSRFPRNGESWAPKWPERIKG